MRFPSIKGKSLQQRFLEKIGSNSLTGCREWIGAICKKTGYGKINVPGYGAYGAHRLAWELFCGPIPQGRLVLHHCDNRRCVEISHLFLGSYRDNVLDMISKGRRVIAPRYGEDHHGTCLTWDVVSSIREDYQKLPRYSSGRVLYGEVVKLAKKYGVSRGIICDIGKGNVWRTKNGHS